MSGPATRRRSAIASKAFKKRDILTQFVDGKLDRKKALVLAKKTRSGNRVAVVVPKGQIRSISSQGMAEDTRALARRFIESKRLGKKEAQARLTIELKSRGKTLEQLLKEINAHDPVLARKIKLFFS